MISTVVVHVGPYVYYGIVYYQLSSLLGVATYWFIVIHLFTPSPWELIDFWRFAVVSCSCSLETKKKRKKSIKTIFRNISFRMLLCTSHFALWGRVWLWCRLAGSSSSSQPLLCNICSDNSRSCRYVAWATVICLIKLFRVHVRYSITQLANLSSHVCRTDATSSPARSQMFFVAEIPAVGHRAWTWSDIYTIRYEMLF